MNLSNKTRKWIRAGLETFIHGGAAAVSSTVAVNVIDPGHWGATVKGLQLAGATFLINGGIRFTQWWQANPLPEAETTPPIPGAPTPPQISLNPLGQVQSIPVQPAVDKPQNQS